MGWKTINGRQYYYTCERVGGKVQTRYVGTGLFAGLAAQLEADRRAEEADKRDERRAERERDEAKERELADWFDAVEALADATMLAAGYHKHKGQWRRRRNGGGDREHGRGQAPRGDGLEGVPGVGHEGQEGGRGRPAGAAEGPGA